MSNEKVLAGVLLPFIAGAVYFVWKESNESSNPKPAAAVVSQPVEQAPAVPVTHRSVEGTASEDAPRDVSPENAAVIDQAKNAPAFTLDPSLPHESFDYWLAHAAGSAARLRWEVNDCPGTAKQEGSASVCAQANLVFSNGTRFQTLMLLGERPTNPPGPVQYGRPSILWGAYEKAGGPLTPIDITDLPKLASQAN